MTFLARVCAIAALTLASSIAAADELPIRVEGAVSTSAAARARVELEALGHRVVTAESPPVETAGDVRFEETSGASLVAVVTMRDRAPVRVAVDAGGPEAEGIFALRVAEAVRAGLLRAHSPTAPPPVIVAPIAVVPVAPAIPERAFAVGLGARVLLAPGGVGPMLLPSVRVRLGATWFVDASFAGPSFLGDAGASMTLRALQVSLGGGRAFALTARGRLEVAARLDYLALSASVDGSAQPVVRDGTLAASAVGALRWSVHQRVAVRVGVSLGATFGSVDLGIGGRTVAEWGRPLMGAEVGAELCF